MPLSATRRAIARHMTESHATIPVAWMAVEANVSGLVELRRRVRAEFEQAHGLRLTYMPFFVRAIVETLQKHPALNASYSEDGVVRHARLDMGIAVATDAGLLVPVLREADRKSLPKLARELQDLAERARARTLATCGARRRDADDRQHRRLRLADLAAARPARPSRDRDDRGDPP